MGPRTKPGATDSLVRNRSRASASRALPAEGGKGAPEDTIAPPVPPRYLRGTWASPPGSAYRGRVVRMNHHKRAVTGLCLMLRPILHRGTVSCRRAGATFRRSAVRGDDGAMDQPGAPHGETSGRPGASGGETFNPWSVVNLV